jgi:hypothetical protein
VAKEVTALKHAIAVHRRHRLVFTNLISLLQRRQDKPAASWRGGKRMLADPQVIVAREAVAWGFVRTLGFMKKTAAAGRAAAVAGCLWVACATEAFRQS